jgi:long-chain-fatty-acyl-CoA reductase
MSEVLDLPLIVAGTKRYATASDEAVTFRTGSGLLVRTPVLTTDDVARIVAGRERAVRELSALTITDVTGFFSDVGRRWIDPGSPGRKLVSAYASAFTQLATNMIDRDCLMIGSILAHPYHTYDAIAGDFGNERFLDEWTPEQALFRRGVPRGLVLHYLVGNIPLASQYSLVRGMTTKNMNLAKWARRDPITPLGLIETFLDVEADHPLSRNLSAAYWNHDDPIGDTALAAADAVCLWGGHSAVESVKRRIRPGVSVAEYGPRWSASVIDLDRCDAEEAAYRLVEDVANYDQEACLNSQRAFVKGDPTELLRRLPRHFETFQKVYPLSTVSRDALAHRALSLTEADYLGWEMRQGDGWAVVVIRDPAEVTVHPLGRTLYIHQVDDIAEVTRHLTRRSQTLGVYPYELALEHDTGWSLAGVDRICELGWARAPRFGWAHDGAYALHPLVRVVVRERPTAAGSKYQAGRNTQGWVRSRFRLDQVPDLEPADCSPSPGGVTR